MPFRHAAELPERFLNAGAERFERFRKAQRHAFDVAPGQHAVKERVIKSLPGDLHTKFIADGEVTGRQSPRMMVLTEENGLARAMQASPFVHASFECSACGIGKPARMRLLQPFEKRLCFQSRFKFQSLLNAFPNRFKRIISRSICSSRFLLRRQSVVIAKLACRFLAHFRHPC